MKVGTNGPWEKWQGKTWMTVDGIGRPVTLTVEDLRSVYDAIKSAEAAPRFRIRAQLLICECFPGARSLSDRRCDRSLQLLKKEGLVEYRHGQWRTTGGEA